MEQLDQGAIDIVRQMGALVVRANVRKSEYCSFANNLSRNFRRLKEIR